MRRGIIYTTLFVLILISVTKSAFINQFADVKKFFQSLGDESAEKKLSDEVQVISDKLDKKDLKLKQNKAYTTVGAGVKDFVVGIKSGDPYQITSGVLKIASGITAFLAVPIVPQILNLLAMAIAVMKPKDVRDPLKTALQEFGTEQIRKELQGKLEFVIGRIGDTTESWEQRKKYITELENIKYKFDQDLRSACSDKTRNEECLKLVDAFVAFRSAYCLLVFASYEDTDEVKQKLNQTFDEDYISFEFLINLVKAGPNNKIFSAVMRTPGQYKNIQFFIRNLMGHFDADKSKSQFFKTIYLCDDLTATLCSAIGDRANEKHTIGAIMSYHVASRTKPTR
ncbi:uncharacterized protein LOC130612449 [Hydractinia symbiolongicarpus]|uniref:uncharacterized protein LOC130612449 n=1 Tax=Hydractinia symbiolongicarpus TaxID=13093 RepID=UPI00254E8A40|nr:uncharacterized protein LOC130612449 [Hydractinia symbiolongicarpus]